MPVIYSTTSPIYNVHKYAMMYDTVSVMNQDIKITWDIEHMCLKINEQHL